MQVGFSAGAMWGRRTDVANVSPDQFGLLQDVSVDFDFTTKQLYGEYQFPAVIARGQAKVTGKARFARIFGALYADLMFGETVATGGIMAIENEAGTIPGVSTYTVTVANSATWSDDLGVYYAATGLRLKQVASGPTTGQYSVASGVYTFAAADANLGVLISYLYAPVTGTKFTINNHFMGITPTFKCTLFNQGQTQNTTNPRTLVLNACLGNKLSFPTKIDDFQITEFDFEAYADASNVIGTFSSVE